MKPFTRTASVIWEGSHQHGEGAITTQSAVLKKARYVSDHQRTRGKGTNPPELIAAAHASSFSMALANELGQAGYCPEQIDTTATVTMEHVAAEWTMTLIHLDVVAWVPRAAQCDFIDAAVRAENELFHLAPAAYQGLDGCQVERSASRSTHGRRPRPGEPRNDPQIKTTKENKIWH